MNEFPTRDAAERRGWAAVRVGLDRLVLQSLVGAGEPSRGVCEALKGDDSAGDLFIPLAAWLEHLFQIMRDVDGRAIEILALRLEGFDYRDIAGRTGVGMRMVKRIAAEMALSWEHH